MWVLEPDARFSAPTPKGRRCMPDRCAQCVRSRNVLRVDMLMAVPNPRPRVRPLRRRAFISSYAPILLHASSSSHAIGVSAASTCRPKALRASRSSAYRIANVVNSSRRCAIARIVASISTSLHAFGGFTATPLASTAPTPGSRPARRRGHRTAADAQSPHAATPGTPRATRRHSTTPPASTAAAAPAPPTTAPCPCASPRQPPFFVRIPRLIE